MNNTLTLSPTEEMRRLIDIVNKGENVEKDEIKAENKPSLWSDD